MMQALQRDVPLLATAVFDDSLLGTSLRLRARDLDIVGNSFMYPGAPRWTVLYGDEALLAEDLDVPEADRRIRQILTQLPG
jgi:hypothetical protein